MRSAFSTTCRFVTMNPLPSTITPEPRERSRITPSPGPPGAGLAARSTEEVVEEVVHPSAATAVIVVRILSAALAHILDGRFRVDVDYAGFQLLRNLRKSVRHLLRRGQA